MLKVLALGALATVLMLLDVVVCFPISGPEVTGLVWSLGCCVAIVLTGRFPILGGVFFAVLAVGGIVFSPVETAPTFSLL